MLKNLTRLILILSLLNTTGYTSFADEFLPESVIQPQSIERPHSNKPEQGLNATDLIQKSDDLMRGKTNQGLYTMEITTKRWTRKLKLHVYSQGRDHVFIRILSPAKERGIGTLRINNEMWNYLPSVEKIIKIPPSLMLQPWMGSDFANDDLVKESSIVHDYSHDIIAEEIINGMETYKIALTPKPDAPVIWGKIIRWIRQEDTAPVREQYYNERGKLIKELNYSNFGLVSDRIIPKTWTMESMIKKPNKTVIELIDVTYNEPIKSNIFSIPYLKKSL